MNGTETLNKNIAASWMPGADGKMQPAPDLLTQAEAIRFLRLDATKTRFPGNSLLRYRKECGLKAVQIGKQVLFPLAEITKFISRQIEQNPR